jgi:hypothetical protein
MNWWLNWLGVLGAALSLISLAKQLWNFPLTPFFAQMLDFYRSLLHPPAEFIGWLLSWAIWVTPPADLVVLFAIAGTALNRSIVLQNAKDGYEAHTRVQFILRSILHSVTLPIVVIVHLAMAIRHRDLEPLRGWIREIAKVAAAVLVFFALNAGMA